MLQLRHPSHQLGDVGVLQHVLVLRSRDAVIELHLLRRLHQQPDAGHRRQCPPNPSDDLLGAGRTVPPRLQSNVESSGVRCRIQRAHPHEARHARDIGLPQNNVGDRALPLEQGLERDIQCRLSDANNKTGVLLRQKPLWNHDVEVDRRRQGN